MTEADLVIIATAIAVVGVMIVGVIVNAPARHDLHRKEGRQDPH